MQLEESVKELALVRTAAQDADNAAAKVKAELEQAKQPPAGGDGLDDLPMQAEVASLKSELAALKTDLDCRSKELEQSKAEADELKNLSSNLRASKDTLQVVIPSDEVRLDTSAPKYI